MMPIKLALVRREWRAGEGRGAGVGLLCRAADAGVGGRGRLVLGVLPCDQIKDTYVGTLPWFGCGGPQQKSEKTTTSLDETTRAKKGQTAKPTQQGGRGLPFTAYVRCAHSPLSRRKGS